MSPRSDLVIPVDHPVLDGLGDVDGVDVALAGEVGDRSCHPEHPVMGPGAQPELRDGRLEKLLRFGIDRAIALDLLCPHLGVRVELPVAEAGELGRPGPRHPLPDLLRALRFLPRDDVAKLDLGDLNLNIDPVEERPRDPRIIAAALSVGAVGLGARQPPEDVLAGLCCLFAMSP
jgi:hypothetical protein